jgi:putative toxin-antitoxin system antitoxin component (TIGR02293 family)
MKKENKTVADPKTFDPKKSIERARGKRTEKGEWSLTVVGKEYVWASKMDRVAIIRQGIPYNAIEVVSINAGLPVGQVLQLLGVPQTTYNKKKKDNDLLNRRDSEIMLILSEVMQYGVDVFNNEEEKFHRWLKKPNISLGGVSPESLFDSLTGIQEVKYSLNRLEYGNLS